MEKLPFLVNRFRRTEPRERNIFMDRRDAITLGEITAYKTDKKEGFSNNITEEVIKIH